MKRTTQMTAALLVLIAGAAAGCAGGSSRDGGAPGVLHGRRTADQPVTLDQLPVAVRLTIEQQSKGGAIQEIERCTVDGAVVYEIEIGEAGGGHFDIAVAENGAFLGVEDDDGPDDDDDGPDDDDGDDDDGPDDDDGGGDDGDDDGDDGR